MSTAGTSSKSVTDQRILVLDFGGQYAQLIARRVREQRVYCEVVRHDITVAQVRKHHPAGLILSGGPASVYEGNAPKCDPGIFQMGIPVLGICYGMQLACDSLGGQVTRTSTSEYGRTVCQFLTDDRLLVGMPGESVVWMSHGDQVSTVSEDFVPLATTGTCPIAAVRHRSLPVYGLQFHPEVTHTPEGNRLIANFVRDVCDCDGRWTMGNFAQEAIERIREQVGDRRVICGLSGGVDSSVTAALLFKAIGRQLTCILVDNGLLRAGEQELVANQFSDHFQTDLRVVQAESRFLAALEGIVEPQEKRKRIGHVFIECFTDEAEGIQDAHFLAQGTLYPDVIESGAAPDGPAATIKLHHNVGGLPDELGFELIEPLRDLFKDEVRKLGLELGLPEEIVWRHPFPGPGLAVPLSRGGHQGATRHTPPGRSHCRRGDSGGRIIPGNGPGVCGIAAHPECRRDGDARTYERTVVVRCVDTDDFMTADWTRLPFDLLAKISTRIINEVKGVNRVAYDISSKPPATIEWE